MRQRILFLTHEFPPFSGGVGTYASEIARAAFALGHDVSVVAPDYGKENGAVDAVEYPFPVHRFPGSLYRDKHFFQLIGEVRRRTVGRKYDLYFAVDYSFAIGLAFWKRLGLVREPYWAMVHGTDILSTIRHSRWARLFGLRNPYQWAERVVTNSEFTRNMVFRQYPQTPQEKVEACLLGVSPYWLEPVPEEQREILRQHLGLSARARMVLTVSRLDERKGHLAVIAALQRLPIFLREELTYVIAGARRESPYVQALDAAARESRVPVVFTGEVSREEVRALYSLARVFCMPSRSHATKVEGFGLAYLEAAAQGVPSIATMCGGVPESVGEGGGLLIEPEDSVALEGALARLLNETPEVTQFQTSCRERAKRMTWDACAQKTFRPLDEKE